MKPKYAIGQKVGIYCSGYGNREGVTKNERVCFIKPVVTVTAISIYLKGQLFDGCEETRAPRDCVYYMVTPDEPNYLYHECFLYPIDDDIESECNKRDAKLVA